MKNQEIKGSSTFGLLFDKKMKQSIYVDKQLFK